MNGIDPPPIDAILKLGPVIPVVTIAAARDAVPLARALRDGGLRAIEVTLRTPAGLEAIERIAGELPDMVVGAGTVLRADQMDRAARAGAAFLVSPGLTANLLRATADCQIPLLPGVATPGEAMMALEAGLSRLKFFPAEPAGGVPMLTAIHGPLRDLVFCPTGGVSLNNAATYLACPNVACVGGSWLTPTKAVEEGAWTVVSELTREAIRRLAPVTGGDARSS